MRGHVNEDDHQQFGVIAMPVQFSSAIPARERGQGRSFSVRSIDLEGLGMSASPLAVLDDFRVRGRPFGPHPHAGFAAVTYVFEDSRASLRSRDSLGGDTTVGPGGIVWTHAGSGVIHEELPAQDDGRELHGLQVFVNLSAKNKLTAPKVFKLHGAEVPEWRDEAGDCVRVVVGAFDGIASPLVPAEPFTLLDVTLQHEISIDLLAGNNVLVYAPSGSIFAKADGLIREVAGGHAIVLQGRGRVTFEAIRQAHMVVLSGPEIREPVFVDGPFIMNDRAQSEAALARYRAGQMGRIAPAAED